MQKQKPETENSQKGEKSWGGPGPGSGQDPTSRTGKLKNGKLKNQVKRRALAKSNPQDRSGFPGWGFKTPAAGTFNYITADRFFYLGT